MKSKKPIRRLVFFTLLAAGAYLYFNAGSMITRTAEDIASNALGVRVNIGSINLSLSDKKVTVSTLEIGNPSGYRKSNAITAEAIVIGLNTASSDLIDFKKIEVKGSVVNLEMNEKGMNLNDLKNMAARKEKQGATGSKQIRVIIEHMVIEASTINPSISFLDRDVASVKMPPIRFSNIGKGGGAQAGDVIVQVITKYVTAVERTARNEGLLDQMPGVGDVKKTLDDAAGELQGLFR